MKENGLYFGKRELYEFIRKNGGIIQIRYKTK